MKKDKIQLDVPTTTKEFDSLAKQETRPTPRWNMFDLLDTFQLGMLYEMLMINAANDKQDESYKEYIHCAGCVRDAIDANCGFEAYVLTQQKECRIAADYDYSGGYRSEHQVEENDV